VVGVPAVHLSLEPPGADPAACLSIGRANGPAGAYRSHTRTERSAVRRLIALGASVFLLAIGASAGPAFAQVGSAEQSAGNTGGSQASSSGSTTPDAGQIGAVVQEIPQDSGTVQNANISQDADADAEADRKRSTPTCR
jgi:hypothetical protein